MHSVNFPKNNGDIFNFLIKNQSDFLFNNNQKLSSDICLLNITYLNETTYGAEQIGNNMVAWFGKPFYLEVPLNRENTKYLLKDLETNIEDALNKISGHFSLVVILDNKIYIIADKVSSCPIYYTIVKNSLIFSPEPLSFRSLKKFGWEGKLREEAIYEFLGSGHLWGDGTFWKDVKRVGPGSYIIYDGFNIETHSYWKMVFNNNLKENKIAQNLFNAINLDLNKCITNNPLLTLSGGYDSRGLLGLLIENQIKFDIITYSFGETSKKLDYDVALQLGNEIGKDIDYYKPDIEPLKIIKNIKNGIIISGGESDTVIGQDCFLGDDFYQRISSEYDCLIRGDEVWGWGDRVSNYQMAYVSALLFNLNEIPHPKILLKDESYKKGINYLSQLREELIKEYGSSSVKPNDLKDYLYWRHREARLLQNMRYYRSVFINNITPFTMDNTIELIKEIPGKSRMRKGYYIKAIKERYPDLFYEENMATPYMGYKNRFEIIYEDDEIKKFIRKTLIDNPPELFNQIFEKENLELWIEDIINNTKSYSEPTKKRYNIIRWLNDVININQYIGSHVKSFLIQRMKLKFPVQKDHYLFRILVLALALEEYEKINLTTVNSLVKSAEKYG